MKPELSFPVRKLVEVLKNNQGLILGESTAVSTRVHSMTPKYPGVIKASESDAGEVFYSRKKPHEVIHIDCFHEIGHLDHVKLANYLKEKMPEVIKEHSLDEKFPDYIDIQTGTGGGRLTGSLSYGKKNTLKQAHKNHVHLAMYLLPEKYGAIYSIVWYLEKGIMEQNFELRKIDKIIIKPFKQCGNGDSSLEDYSTDSDSNLKENSNNYGSRKTTETKANQVKEIANKEGGVSEAIEMMKDLQVGVSKQNFFSKHFRRRELFQSLQENKIAKEQNGKITLTKYGEELISFMRKHLPEIESRLKMMVRDMSRQGEVSVKKLKRRHGENKNHMTTIGKLAQKPKVDDHLEHLALPETIVASAIRSIKDNNNIKIDSEDIRVMSKQKHATLNLCFLVDASGSMAGRRMQEVKFLAEHALLSGRDRISVITFREDKATVEIPFTKNWNQLRKGLSSVKAFGLTPMAKGIEEGRKFLLEKIKENTNKRNTFLVLITDGLPTISANGEDPFRETLKSAEKIKEAGIKFICIGLKPNVEFLEKLAERSGSSLYIVQELESQSLANIIARERNLG
ncbi:vWA domain-containing protein [Natranaerobius trueperi]|uniref:VWFA domain-containing protein n=1 Tax=Natranaerobius trueperi TaxID=759412 RepID=A0A226BYF2_9FIRM|nr:VWA domain-containing protein [Natranaerobius trueperi]OWZ83802.1 hypothetical protein CDO51_06830 [Natranaerobius trueperi]